MLRLVFVGVVAIHALVHLIGFAKAFGFVELPPLAQPISRPAGVVWLATAGLMAATATAFTLWPRGWWLCGALALLASQTMIALSWGDAKYGTLVNLILLGGVLYGAVSQGPWSFRAAFERSLLTAGSGAASGLLTEADLASLPEPVRRYMRQAGALGHPPVQNFRATWTGRIRGSGKDPWMPFAAEQFNTFDPPRRFFKMDATMKGLPVDVLHTFDERGATMRVLLLSAIPLADAKGPDLTRAETVTILNDLCILAPGALHSPLLTWEPIDDRTSKVHFTLQSNSVTADLYFNELDELVDFHSEDRMASSPDGRTFTRMPWSTPVRDYARMGPARVATHGDAVWHADSGAFAYGEFELKSLVYNVRP